MGRVDEAMRRAAEVVENAADRGRALEAEESTGVGREPKSEAFPSEAPAVARRLRPVTTEAQSPSAGDVAVPVRPLFARLSPGLAAKVVVDEAMDPVSREQYRRLATGLHAAQVASGLKVVAVSSALAGEGKSLTAANLAMTLSESYQRSVLLIDGDLRRPSVERIFGLPSGSGLSDGLLASADQRMNLHRITAHLTVLTAGRPTGDPMATLASSRMRQLVAEARESFDWVIIDTPPIGLLSDANLLANVADGTLLVVRADFTPYDVVQRALSALGKDRILGVILNQATDVGPAGKYHSYYHATSSSQT